MGTYDDFEYGAHKSKPTQDERNTRTQDMVRDIIKGQAQPGRGLRQVDIAAELHARRDGDSIPFEGEHKRNVQGQVHHILNILAGRGEIEDKSADAEPDRRGRAPRPRWGIAAPVGEPKDKAFYVKSDPDYVAESRRTGRLRKGDKKNVPETQDPSTWGEARRQREAARVNPPSARVGDPANWGRKGQRRREPEHNSPDTWGEHRQKLRDQAKSASDRLAAERAKHDAKLDAQRAKSEGRSAKGSSKSSSGGSSHQDNLQRQRDAQEARYAAARARQEGKPSPKGGGGKDEGGGKGIFKKA